MLELVAGKQGAAHDLAAVVEVVNRGASPSEAAEIDHFAVLPKKSARDESARTAGRKAGIRASGDLSHFVDAHSHGVRTTKRPEVAHDAIFPEIGTRLIKAPDGIGILSRVQGEADDLTGTVDGRGDAEMAAIQCAQVDEFTVLPKNSVHVPITAERILHSILGIACDQAVGSYPAGLAVSSSGDGAKVCGLSTAEGKSASNVTVAIVETVFGIRVGLRCIRRADERACVVENVGAVSEYMAIGAAKSGSKHYVVSSLT